MVSLSNIAAKVVTMTTGLTYTIGSTVKTVPALAAYVEETDSVPFCCYQINSDAPIMSKAGIRGWDSSVSLYVVSDDENEAELIKNSIVNGVDTYRTATFYPKIANIYPQFQDGCWMYKIDYEFKTLV